MPYNLGLADYCRYIRHILFVRKETIWKNLVTEYVLPSNSWIRYRQYLKFTVFKNSNFHHVICCCCCSGGGGGEIGG
jgi:hypothetical protein